MRMADTLTTSSRFADPEAVVAILSLPLTGTIDLPIYAHVEVIAALIAVLAAFTALDLIFLVLDLRPGGVTAHRYRFLFVQPPQRQP